MIFNYPMFIIGLAGIINASFFIPARYIKKTSTEKIWLYHSVIGLMIIPWIIFLLLYPGASSKYFSLQDGIFFPLLLGGAIFGAGQVCFAYAIDKLGVALGFTINLATGAIIGSMFLVFYKDAFLTKEGTLVTLAVILIVAALILYYAAGKHGHTDKRHYQQGWGFGLLAGLASGIQNITFVILAFDFHTKFSTAQSFWVWPPFLLVAGLVMIIGFSYRIKQHQEAKTKNTLQIKSLIMILLMGLFFTGSLALYSIGMSEFRAHQKIFGWPTFIVMIILTCQYWGWKHKEIKNTTRAKKTLFASVSCLIAAVLILSLASK